MVAEELGAEIVAIKKTSEEYSTEKNPPPCPSVILNNQMIVSNGTVTYEDLMAAIRKNR